MNILYFIFIFLQNTRDCTPCTHEGQYLTAGYDSTRHLFYQKNVQMGELGLFISDLSCLKCKKIYNCDITVGIEGESPSRKLYALLLHSEDEKLFYIKDTLSTFTIGSRFNLKFKPNPKEYIVLYGNSLSGIILRTLPTSNEK